MLAVAERALFSGDVMPGVEVDGVSVSGSSESDAYADISALAAELESEPITASARDITLVVAPGEIGFDVDEEATVRAARQAARSRNPVDQTVGAVLRRFRSEPVALQMSWDDEKLDEVVNRWFRELSEGVSNGDLTFEGAQVVEVAPEPGLSIDRADTRELLEQELLASERSRIPLPIVMVQPDITQDAVAAAAERARALLSEDIVVIANDNFLVLTPERLATALTTRAVGSELELDVDPEALGEALGDDFLRLIVPPTNATFATSGVNVSVVPHTNGKSPDIDSLIESILAGEKEITTPVIEIEPERTTEWAEDLDIVEVTSTFTTNYPSGQARVTNIQQAARNLDMTIVPPGATFSFNDTVGARTTERGFVSAPVFYGEFTEDVGGGVSQVATTFFNAVFYGGYEDVTHKPHSLYFSRYPRVIEATVNYPNLDLKFRNNTNAGVLIRAGAGSSSVTISFYGNNGDKTVRLEGPNVLETFPVEDEYTDDPLLEFGTEIVEENGIPGFSAEAFRIIEEPGKDPVRERFFWRYRMFPNQVRRGTAEPTTTTLDPESTTTVPDSSSTTSVPSSTTVAPTTTAASTTTVPPTTTTTVP